VETYTEPRPLERKNPNYPGLALKDGREGWAKLSFVILPTGEVAEAMIEDSSGDKDMERAARAAVEQWRYEPARRNGEPVAQAMNETIIRFMLEDGERGARRGFVSRYRAASESIRTGDVATAAARIAELEADGSFNIYETAWFWFLKWYHLEASKSTDLAARVRALEAATAGALPDAVMLDPELHVTAMQRLFVLHVNQRNYGAAMTTFERLRDLVPVQRAPNYQAALAAMRQPYDAMAELVAAQNVLVTPAEIGEHDYWIGHLLRRSFALDGIEGRVDVVDIRCERGTARYGFKGEDELWTVPASWGDCGIYIKGEAGTTFAFQQYPSGSSAAAPISSVSGKP
jgi:TonB family protein